MGHGGKSNDESERCEIEKRTKLPSQERTTSSSDILLLLLFCLLQFQSIERTFTPWIFHWQPALAVRATQLQPNSLNSPVRYTRDCHSCPALACPLLPTAQIKSASSSSPPYLPIYLPPTYSNFFFSHSCSLPLIMYST